MTPEQLATWRQLADAATWEYWQQDYDRVVAWQDDEKYYEKVADCVCDNVAAFIAAAREAVPALLDEVERLRAERNTAADTLQAIHDKPIGAWTYGELQVLEMRLRGQKEMQPYR